MLSNKRNKLKMNKKLIFEEPTNLSNFEDKAKLKEEKQKQLDKEQNRIKLIEKKFSDYKLSFTNNELAETIDRVGIGFLSLDGAKFHLKFLKVMEYESKNCENTKLEDSSKLFKHNDFTANN